VSDRPLPLDAHLHTDLSPDADVPIDVYAAAALAAGVRELAITDHVDFEPGAPAFAYTTFADRERVVRGAAERWGPQGVDIRFGVELTYDRSWEADIRHHLRIHAYDFTIGSVHDRIDSPYSSRNVQAWVWPVLAEVSFVVRRGRRPLDQLFDAIGHIDVVKRYLNPPCCRRRSRPAGLYEPILQALVDSGRPWRSTRAGSVTRPARPTHPRPSWRASASLAGAP
jgi:histidinol-phosphatase (PHP family)